MVLRAVVKGESGRSGAERELRAAKGVVVEGIGSG
jgi:hypothetical protein